MCSVYKGAWFAWMPFPFSAKQIRAYFTGSSVFSCISMCSNLPIYGLFQLNVDEYFCIHCDPCSLHLSVKTLWLLGLHMFQLSVDFVPDKLSGFIPLEVEPLLICRTKAITSLVTEQMFNHPSLSYWFTIRWQLFKENLVLESKIHEQHLLITMVNWMTLDCIVILFLLSHCWFP